MYTSKLAKFSRKSKGAIDIVTKVINKLTSLNKEIDAEIESIKIEQERLLDEQGSLLTTKNSNAKIIENFGSLLK